MTALADFKAEMQRGTPVVEVTNHYITREDHPCFGTNLRVVTKTNGSAFYMLIDAKKAVADRVEWPKASKLAEEVGPTGRVWKLFGTPKDPAALFLTIRVVSP